MKQISNGADRSAKWNSRYLAYAQSRGLTPPEALAADKVAYPGGCMAGFMIWNMSRISEFLRETGAHRSVLFRRGAYDDWLATRFSRGQLELLLEVA